MMLDRPLVVVTGKGGVGKSTVAAALGLAAARRGLRTIIAEVARRDDVSRVLGGTGVHEDELAPDLHHISIDPQDALEEYLDRPAALARAGRRADPQPRLRLPAPPPRPGCASCCRSARCGSSRRPTAARRARGRYDLVVLDAPATGHSVGVLSAPRTFADAALRRAASRARAGRSTRCSATRRRPASSRSPAPRRCRSTRRSRCSARCPRRSASTSALIVANGLLPDRFAAAEVAALREAPPGAADARRAARPCPRAAPSAPSSPGCAAAPRRRWSRCRSCPRRCSTPTTDRAARPRAWSARCEASAWRTGASSSAPARAAWARRRRRPRWRWAWPRRAQASRSCTIDPARRLANSLGLAELDNEPRLVDPARFEGHGIEMRGELWAMMLDAKRTFDELVERLAPDRARPATTCSTTASTSSCRARWPARRSSPRWPSCTSCDRSGHFDVLVLDTPPSRNALDFLDAPDRLTAFLEGRALKVFLAPSGNRGARGRRGHRRRLLGAAAAHRGRPARGPRASSSARSAA